MKKMLTLIWSNLNGDVILINRKKTLIKHKDEGAYLKGGSRTRKRFKKTVFMHNPISPMPMRSSPSIINQCLLHPHCSLL